jgi:hypothetical protein
MNDVADVPHLPTICALTIVLCKTVASRKPKDATTDPNVGESSISASSWGGAGWCVRTCAYGSWWHGEGDEPAATVLVSGHSSSERGHRGVAYVALAADHLVAVELGGKGLE